MRPAECAERVSAMMVLKSILIAFSMFSVIPVPQTEWNESSMRFSLCAFPLIGIVIALCCRGWWALCSVLSLPTVLQGAGLCLLPVWITGGIHLDGFADTLLWSGFRSARAAASQEASPMLQISGQ